MSEKITLLFDTELMRPACVLLQAVANCGHNNEFLQMTFDSSDWLTAPTDDMKRVTGTVGEWKQIAGFSKSK